MVFVSQEMPAIFLPQMGSCDSVWNMRVNIIERIVWYKMHGKNRGPSVYHGRPSKRIIMMTIKAYWTSSHIWCPDCMRRSKICSFHEVRISGRRFRRMRDGPGQRSRRGAINHK
jgi:hypothetical protein